MHANLLRNLALLTILSLPGSCSPMLNGQSEASRDLAWKVARNVVRILPAVICTSSQVSTLVHELGHAIPARVFFKSPINIHLGKREEPQLFSVAGVTVHKDAFTPHLLWLASEKRLTGGSVLNMKDNALLSENLDNKFFMVYAGGPIVQAIYGGALIDIARKFFSDDPLAAFLLRYGAINIIIGALINMQICKNSTWYNVADIQANGANLHLLRINNIPLPDDTLDPMEVAPLWNPIISLTIAGVQFCKIALVGKFIYHCLIISK